jgi:hypothetical protein
VVPLVGIDVLEAADVVLFADLHCRGIFAVADAVFGDRAAGVEAASLAEVEGGGDGAFDGGELAARLPPHVHDRGQKRLGVGVVGLVEDGVHVRLLHDPAEVHHRDLVGYFGDHPEVVGDEDDRHVELALQVLDQLQHLRLHGHVERGGGLVGDQQAGAARQRHGDHGPLPETAGEFVRVGAKPLRGIGNVDAGEHLGGDVAGLVFVSGDVKQDALDDLVADGVDWREGLHRLLEDLGDLAAADVLDLAAGGVELGQVDLAAVAPVEQDLAADPAGPGHDAQQRLRGDALAAATLANQAQGAAAPDREADPVDRLEQPVVEIEVGLEVFDLEDDIPIGLRLRLEGRVCHGSPTCRGRPRRAARRPGS